MKQLSKILQEKSSRNILDKGKKTKPVSASILKIPKLTPSIIKNNKSLLDQIRQNTELAKKIVGLNLDPAKPDFVSRLSQGLIDKGFEPFFYQYRDDESGEGMVAGGFTYYIPNTDVGVSYEPGAFGVSLGNLAASYVPSTGEASAILIIPIGK